MARSKSRRRSNRRYRRDYNIITNRHRLPVPTQSRRLIQYEDRRQWHPEKENRPAASFSQSRHRLQIPTRTRKIQKYTHTKSSRSKSPFSYLSSEIGFRNAKRILICVRRKVRKEVLFAKKKTGKVGQKRPKFNQYSKVSCRS
jgi:hypothetical protein